MTSKGSNEKTTRVKVLFVLFLLAVGSIFFFACSRGKEQDEAASPEPAAAASLDEASPREAERPEYQPVEVGAGGAVQGSVRFQGSLPVLEEMPVGKDPGVCGPRTPNSAYQLGLERTVSQAVVSLTGIEEGRELQPLAGAARFEIKGCTAIPRLQIVPWGTVLEITNGDPILHEVQARWAGAVEREEYDFVLPVQHFQARLKLQHVGLVVLTCAAGHPWMIGHVIVQEHPYYAVTDLNGAFLLSDVPSGNYHLRVWHELLGESQVPITIESGITSVVDVELTAPQNR